MKRLKYFIFAVGAIILLPQLLMFAKPISYWYWTHGATEIDINYSNNLLLGGEYDFDNVPENSKYIPFEVGSWELDSEEIHLRLPNRSDSVIVDITATDNDDTYAIESCFRDGDNYCLLLRLAPMYNPLNSKTHKGDKLVIIDKNGEIKLSFETASDEWVLDCVDNNALLYNVSENSFYYKNVESGIIDKKITNEFKDFKKVAFDKKDNAWSAKYRIDNKNVSYILEF